MSTVIVSVATTGQQFPASTVSTGIVITLVGAAVAPVHVTAAPYTATFTDVTPGTYSASAQSVDQNGAPIGAAAVSEPFTVSAPDVTIDIPQTVTVAIQ